MPRDFLPLTAGLEAGNPGTDVFVFWQAELKNRKQLRKTVTGWQELATLKADRATLDFLFRTLFMTGKRVWFYLYLLANSGSMPVIRWLRSCPLRVKIDFLEQLPYLLPELPGKKLDFLINLYDSSLEAAYSKVLAVLSLEELEYLTGRTGNPEFRRLLRNRRQQLITSRRQENLGLELEVIRIGGWDNMFGNKVDLARKTLASLRETAVRGREHPYGYERFLRFMEAAGDLYRLGWLEDCLVLLVEIYQDFMARSRLAEPGQALELYRQMDRLARAVVPAYCLVTFPLEPAREAEQIYREVLANLTPDPASLEYLRFYEKWREVSSTPWIFPQAEITAFCEQVEAFRPGDSFVAVLRNISREVQEPDFAVLLRVVRERLQPRPHESLAVLEFLRWLLATGHTESRSSRVSEGILQGYLDLWHWVPSHVFFSQVVLDTLAPGLAESPRREAARVLRWATESREKVLEFYREKADLARAKGNLDALEAVISNLLGVR